MELWQEYTKTAKSQLGLKTLWRFIFHQMSLLLLRYAQPMLCQVLDLIAQLSDETREILQKEIKKQNYEITPTVANRLSREYFTKVI